MHWNGLALAPFRSAFRNTLSAPAALTVRRSSVALFMDAASFSRDSTNTAECYRVLHVRDSN